jgi:hypothetical protein
MAEATTRTPWRLKVHWLETCNCESGCNCNSIRVDELYESRTGISTL